MKLFMIERNFAQQLELSTEGAAVLNELNERENVRWLISFLSVDKKKTFCLYEAPSENAIRSAAKFAGIPADTILEVSREIMPGGQINPINQERYAA